MSEPKDPERLLADALRAHAVFAPQVQAPAPATEPEQGATGTQGSLGIPGVQGAQGAQGTGGTEAVPTSRLDTPAELPSAYGLLSGASADSLERERAALDYAAATSPPPRPPEPLTVRQQPVPSSAQLPAHWVLLLAVLLGLAAGCVVGLLTLV